MDREIVLRLSIDTDDPQTANAIAQSVASALDVGEVVMEAADQHHARGVNYGVFVPTTTAK